jgi:hypothetical protein
VGLVTHRTGQRIGPHPQSVVVTEPTPLSCTRQRLQDTLPSWIEVVDVVVLTDLPPIEVQATLAGPAGLETVTAFGDTLPAATRRLATKMARAA